MLIRLLPFFTLVACGGTLDSRRGQQDTDFEDTTDTIAPVIEHTPISEAQPFGTDVIISAVVTDDDSGVFSVKLYFKNETAGPQDWTGKAMSLVAENTYEGLIPGDDQDNGGTDYYIEAYDLVQNIAWSPDDGASDSWHYRLYE